MTRAMFFKMLASLGLEQSNKGTGSCIITELNPCISPCKEDEERCPLGHCQKPELGPVFTIFGDENHLGVSKSTTHTCSACGVVYVPRDSAKRSKP